MEASSKAINEVEDEEECVEVSAAAAAETKDCKGSWSKCSPQFTAMEELMVCKAYIKAFEDSIYGSK